MSPQFSPARIPPRAAEELALAVLPQVFAELERTTAELDELGGRIDEASSARLDQLHDLGHRLGWVFGVLSSAQGAELLLARREPEGLRYMLFLVFDRLAEEGVTVRPGASALPRLAAGEAADWRLPWLLALIFLRAGRASRGALTWTLEAGPALHVTGIPVARHAGLVAGLEAARAEVKLESAGQQLVLLLPCARFAPCTNAPDARSR